MTEGSRGGVTLIDRDELLRRALADYDRRRKHWWGRCLLWLLRHTT